MLAVDQRDWRRDRAVVVTAWRQQIEQGALAGSLPFAGDPVAEQALNAQPVVDNSGAILINDDGLTSQTIVDKVIPMITNPDALTVMAEQTAKSSNPNAADDIARRVIAAAR